MGPFCFVIQGLENCLALRFDKGRRGACLFTILLTLLKNLEKAASALSLVSYGQIPVDLG